MFYYMFSLLKSNFDKNWCTERVDSASAWSANSDQNPFSPAEELSPPKMTSKRCIKSDHFYDAGGFLD